MWILKKTVNKVIAGSLGLIIGISSPCITGIASEAYNQSANVSVIQKIKEGCKKATEWIRDNPGPAIGIVHGTVALSTATIVMGISINKNVLLKEADEAGRKAKEAKEEVKRLEADLPPRGGMITYEYQVKLGELQEKKQKQKH